MSILLTSLEMCHKKSLVKKGGAGGVVPVRRSASMGHEQAESLGLVGRKSDCMHV